MGRIVYPIFSYQEIDMVSVGDINQHGQRLVERTTRRGNHRFATVWIVECTSPGCGLRYGANSCDFHGRRCPGAHQPHGGGAPGLEI